MDAVTHSIERADAPARRRMPRAALAGGVGVAVAAAGAFWILSPATAASTDDAYVSADATTVAPRVRGVVSRLLVRDNQPVRAGQPLVQVDPTEFTSRLAAARGDLADAEAALASARAALRAHDAELALARAQVVAARTSIRSAAAEAARSYADRDRYRRLVATGAVSRSDAERAETAAVSAGQEAERARAQSLVAERGEGVTASRLDQLVAAVRTAEARVLKARAAVDLAVQDEGYALVRSPVEGVVGNRQVQLGDYVQPGSRLLVVVPLRSLYVTANFKETQTERMVSGQPATVAVDALGGRRLKAVVESIAPGSGSTFALLPFEPGTGNFTKVVQRVPVRLRLEPGQADLERLRPGLSVTARVELR